MCAFTTAAHLVGLCDVAVGDRHRSRHHRPRPSDGFNPAHGYWPPTPLLRQPEVEHVQDRTRRRRSGMA